MTPAPPVAKLLMNRRSRCWFCRLREWQVLAVVHWTAWSFAAVPARLRARWCIRAELCVARKPPGLRPCRVRGPYRK